VDIESGIPKHELLKMIDHSYELVVRSLTKSARTALGL
jgi:predicted DNA-binding protein (MmcQ/YjbR family)